METRANYVLIGLFTLAVVAGVFGFVYWFQNIGGTGERAMYRVQFDGSVSGLRTGGSVLFNGIRVGEVTALSLDPQRPQQVIASIAIDKTVAVRPDTEIGLEFQGLTGIAALSLKGGSSSAAPLVGSNENPPLLVAPPGATQDVTQAAREALRKVQELIEDNQKVFHSVLENIDKFTGALARNTQSIDSTLANIDKFTATLAGKSQSIDETLASLQQFSAALGRNSDRIDRIAEGLQNLTGGADGKSGEINEAARSLRTLADNLDKRSVDLVAGVNRLTGTGSRQIEALGAEAQRTLSGIDRAVRNLDRNPSRLLFGGSGSSLPEYSGRR